MAMVPALQEPRRRLLSEGDSGAVKLFAAIEEDTVTESGQGVSRVWAALIGAAHAWPRPLPPQPLPPLRRTTLAAAPEA